MTPRKPKRKLKPKPPPYVVAIPSHRRARGFVEMTLDYLLKSDVDLARVHLFLSDEEDRESYSAVIPDEILDQIRVLICTEAKSATDKFNEIHFHFDKGTRVFVMEDDVRLIYSPDNGSNEKEALTALDRVIRAGFNQIKNGGLFGIAPHDNGFYMSGKITRTLKLVVAHAFGFISTKDQDLAVTCPSKTDYERTLRYFVRYGEVVRLDMVGVKTKSYKAKGGMQSDHTHEARKALEQQSCDSLVSQFPGLVAHKNKKTSPFAELRLIKPSLPPEILREQQAALRRARRG